MDALTLKRRIEEIIKDVEKYRISLSEGKKSLWDSDVLEKLDELTKKRHVLGASGQSCPKCGGSGRV